MRNSYPYTGGVSVIDLLFPIQQRDFGVSRDVGVVVSIGPVDACVLLEICEASVIGLSVGLLG